MSASQAWWVSKDCGGRIVESADGAIAMLNLATSDAIAQKHAHLIAASPDLLAAAQAAIRYDEAIRGCADDPEKMSTFCSAEGDDLDALYADWMTLARAAIARVTGTP